MRILSRKDILSNKDVTATMPGQPFGGATVPMAGGSHLTPGSDVASSHQGAPPAGSNPAASWTCVECGKLCDDAEELERHLWDKHHIRPRRRHRG